MKLGSVTVKCPHGCGEDIEVPVMASGPHRSEQADVVYLDITADVTDVCHECSGKKART